MNNHIPFLLPNQIKYKKQGLTEAEVKKSRARYGENSLTRLAKNTFFKKYLASFGDPMIKILLMALGLNIIISIRRAEFFEPMGIAIALFIATLVSTLSEYGSENAFKKLEEQSMGATCRVIRGGKLTVIPCEQLVAGDSVIVSAGERVYADGIISEGEVYADLSALNGESDEKLRHAITPSHEWSLENKGQLFRGSVITSGECVMTVGRVGDSTLYGGVAREVQKPTDTSPLTDRLSQLAKTIGIIGYIAGGLVFAFDLFASHEFTLTSVLHALTLAITVVVVAVPEGLPMMITVVLSSNMKRLKRDNVLVRKPVGIETAGCVSILFCDKTGTLTKGKLSVDAIYDANGNKCAPDRDMIICLGVNNGATLVGKKAVGGNATDRAILSYIGTPPDIKVSEKIPFDSKSKYSSVKIGNDIYKKGAPEVLFNKNFDTVLCNLHKRLTERGYRVLAMAKNGKVIGLISLRDEIRRGVKQAMREAHTAGIHVCMITGDSLLTAKCIANECGLLKKDGICIDRQKLMSMTDCEIKDILPRLCVVARAMPEDKSRLTRLAKDSGQVCAMTGDGINDAPALRDADVGFAMGSGTEVAKQAGDIVILDDSFVSIMNAVLYGRTVFASIRKFIVFQLTINLCAVGISLIGPLINIDTPVTVMQMLWINMIMDTLAGLAFAGEAPDKAFLKRPPHSRYCSVISGKMAGQILFMGGFLLSLCTLYLGSNFFKTKFGFYTDERSFMSAFFALFVFSGLFAGMNARCQSAVNVFYRLSKNKAFMIIFGFIFLVQIMLIYMGGDIFRTTALPYDTIVKIMLLAATVLPADAIRRYLLKKISNLNN